MSKLKERNNKKTFKTFTIEDINMNKCYSDLQKKQKEILSSEKVFTIIEKLSDNKSLFAIKKELEPPRKTTTKKKYDDPFKKQFINVDNYKTLIPNPEDKSNPDNQLLFSFFSHMLNKGKRPVRRSSIFSYMSPTRSPRRHTQANIQNIPSQTITSNMFTTKNFFGATTAETFMRTEESEPTKENKRRQSYYKNRLHGKQLEILNMAQKEKDEIDTFSHTLSRTMRNFYSDGNKENKTMSQKSRNKTNKTIKSITNDRKYIDKSKYFFPLINKVIYEEKKKEDYFEKAKDSLVMKYKTDKLKYSNKLI